MEDKKSRLVGLIKRFPEGGVNMNKKLKIIIIIFLSVICGLLSNATANAEELIRVGDTWRYFKGTSAPPSNWNTLDFDDSAWLQGPTGIGYNADKDVTYATNLTDMMNNYVSFYARRAFSVSDPALFSALELGIIYDNGFIAYINGHEIARSPNMIYPSYAYNVECDTDPFHGEEDPEAIYTIKRADIPFLQAGNNVLAIQVHNNYISGSDAALNPRLNGITNIPPTAVAAAHYTNVINAPVEVGFDDSGSSDSDGRIVKYIWDFGDNVTIESPDSSTVSIVTHTYTSNGVYKVILTVVDDKAGTASDSVNVVVGPARTIYVDKTIPSDSTTYSVANRSGSGGNATAFTTIQKASNNARAGDTILIRAGTYNEIIRPVISGGPGNPITYKNFNNEEVLITPIAGRFPGLPLANVPLGEDPDWYGGQLGIYIYDFDYITIEGLKFDNIVFWARIVNTNNVILKNNIFTRALALGTTGGINILSYREPNDNPSAPHESHRNKVINNIIDDGNDNVVLIHSDSNLIEGNRVTKGRHGLWSIRAGNFNVIRDNYFYNEIQKIGDIDDAEKNPPLQYDAAKYNVVENNIFAKTPSSGNSSPYAGIQFAGQNCIIRNNQFYETVGPALDLTIYYNEARYNHSNRIYNNVFYKTDFAGISLTSAAAYTYFVYDNVFKNNILANSIFVANDTRWSFYTGVLSGKPVQLFTGRRDGFVFEKNNLFNAGGGSEYLITNGTRGGYLTSPHNVAWWNTNYPALFKNNIENDPLFIDAASHDFHLQQNSPMINAGTFLTKTVGTGSGTSMKVEDASYFYDGFGIEGETGDVIQLEGDTKTARVIDIDYVNNILTLDQLLSWIDGQGVSLAYNGSAPDIGAYEYVPSNVLIPGDVNSDSVVNAVDVQACVNHILATQDWSARADVNKDSAINALDIQAIVNIILGV